MRRLSIVVLLVALAIAGLDGTPASARRRPPPPTPTPVPATPTPEPTPTPVPERLRVEQLPAQLEAIAAHAPGRLGITVYDLYRGETFSVHGDHAYPLASVYKLAIAVAAFDAADKHTLDLDQRVLLSAADMRHGTSPIAAEHPRGNVTYTYWQLIRRMLVDSDNTASDYVLGAIGGPEAVQKVIDGLKIRGLKIRKTEADLYADALAHRTFARGGDNPGTPDAVAALLTAIGTENALSLDSTNELLVDLTSVRTSPERFRAGLPPTIRLAHETGTSETIDGVADATNDAGIIMLPDGRYVIVVALLDASNASADVRDALLANVARTVYAAYASVAP
jgi:beta-lactamase class A